MIRHRQRGLTLIEVLLVIVIIGVIVLAAAPQWSDARSHRHLQEASERFRALVSMSRAQAMNESRQYRLEFRLDGTIRARVQFDPLEFPEAFVRIDADWGRTPILFDDTWVSDLLELPDGPPPIIIENDEIEYEEYDEEEYDFELLPIEEFDEAVHVVFQPDGTCDSLRFVIRDEKGRGMELTLDGRTGRAQWFETESVDAETLVRPEQLTPEEEEEELEALRDLEAELSEELEDESF